MKGDRDLPVFSTKSQFFACTKDSHSVVEIWETASSKRLQQYQRDQTKKSQVTALSFSKVLINCNK